MNKIVTSIESKNISLELSNQIIGGGCSKG